MQRSFVSCKREFVATEFNCKPKINFVQQIYPVYWRKSQIKKVFWQSSSIISKSYVLLTSTNCSEAVFLVVLEMSWERARNEFHNECPSYLVPCSFPAWLKIRPQILEFEKKYLTFEHFFLTYTHIYAVMCWVFFFHIQIIKKSILLVVGLH